MNTGKVLEDMAVNPPEQQFFYYATIPGAPRHIQTTLHYLTRPAAPRARSSEGMQSVYVFVCPNVTTMG